MLMAQTKLQRVRQFVEHRVFGIALALMLSVCIYLTGRRAIGDCYFRNGSVASIQKALEWDRDNPQYHDALGTLAHFTGATADLGASVPQYQAATHLSPYNAHFWSDLGAAYDWAGRTDDALRAFKHALRLYPNSPEINWRYANFAFRTRKGPEALRALKFVLAGNSPSHRDVFRLAARATTNDEMILAMLPPQSSVFFDYVNFEMETGNVVAANQAWLRLLQLRLPFELPLAFPYLDALIQHREPDHLATAWSELAERFPEQVGPIASNSNLVTNGSFERPILDGGLDWRVVPVSGAVVSIESKEAFDGGRALHIVFDGKRNLDYGHVFQYVAVRPNTRYRFSWAMRANGLTTDSGPRFQVFDAFNWDKLFLATENTVGTAGWSRKAAEFRTAGDTRLLIVRIARPPSSKLDNQIGGEVWVDGVSLSPEQ
jgi:tetratricopeptide (TPR) repeat protein